MSGHGIVQHRNTPDNNPDTPFEFNAESLKKIKFILSRYPSNYQSSGVMPLLTLAQEQNDNHLTLSAMNCVADMLKVPRIRVYETATFYSMYNRVKLGKYHLQLCGTTPCMLCGSRDIGAVIEKHLNVKLGDTTKDGMFTLTEVECLGACANAPMLQVNNHEFYENLDAESTVRLLDGLRAGKPPAPGPQNGKQRVAEGIMGKTTLFQDVNKPQYEPRDFVKLKKEVEEQAKAKAAADKAAADLKASGATATKDKIA